VCRCIQLIGLLAAVFLTCSAAALAQQGRDPRELVRVRGPQPLSFDELIKLATTDPPPQELQAKLDRLLNEPFINNEATFEGANPNAPFVHELGPVLRIAEWNINRTPRESQVQGALADKAAFLGKVHGNHNSTKLQKICEQLNELQNADVVVLDEIDDGVARSSYENTPGELAKALRMNYAFAVEFVELDNIYAAYSKDGKNETPSHDDQKFGINSQRDLGLEGTALLSRYPIRDARIIRLPVEYDWYHEEIKPLTLAQKIQGWYAAAVLRQRAQRQVRRGSRVALVVDLEVPQSPTGVVTIICPHLENYTDARGRRTQMEYLLPRIAEITNPVIVAGDFNTTGRNAHPGARDQGFVDSLTSFRLWLPPVMFFFNPFPGVLFPWNLVKNANDPTAANVPVLAPNGERALFEDLHEFRFADGGKFAWDGQHWQSYSGRVGTLASSNERSRKGFAPTFFVGRTFHGLIGGYKIDWFLVKTPHHALVSPDEEFQLAPFFGRTYPEINTALGKRISDHAPSTLDLPLMEPQLATSRTQLKP
jgi:endonuclease/exonuclease/phosphatase family metal-dependent hydrolase